MERETGIEPASLAWKARVLPLNYSRTHKLFSPTPPMKAGPRNLLASLDAGGGDWIRTSVGVSQQIYSLPPLATRAPLQTVSDSSTNFGKFAYAVSETHVRLQFFLTARNCLVRLAGIEPTTLGFGGQYSIH